MLLAQERLDSVARKRESVKMKNTAGEEVYPVYFGLKIPKKIVNLLQRFHKFDNQSSVAIFQGDEREEINATIAEAVKIGMVNLNRDGSLRLTIIGQIILNGVKDGSLIEEDGSLIESEERLN